MGPKIYTKAVYVTGVILGLNDCQGWHTFRYINLAPHFLNSAEYESICEDISLFQKKHQNCNLLDIDKSRKKVHESG